MSSDFFKIANKTFQSRLILGTGNYPNIEENLKSIEKSGTEILTIAVRRVNNDNLKNFLFLNKIDWEKFWILPNTAGCQTVEQAIRCAFLGKELANRIGQKENNFVKLEIISDPKYLLPDPLGTLKAAEILVKKGFNVLPYINSDPILARHLEDIGCCTLMPLGSPIGSGQGIQNLESLKIIIENSKIPVIIDAGIGKPSDACRVMEIGASAVLLNTAVAKSNKPSIMAEAMKLAVTSGRLAFKAGIIAPSKLAQASSPLENLIY
jgi:thiazole synthase